MLTQTWPRFPGDTAGTFIRSIAATLAEAGDEVHVLVPHDRELGSVPGPARLHVHSFRYAPTDGLHLLGYSRTMQADVHLRGVAYLLGPAYVVAAARALKRLVARTGAEVINAHWLVPNSVAAALIADGPLVTSLHGTDVYMAERPGLRLAAGYALGKTQVLTGSSQDLVDRALAVRRTPHAHFIPYGVDPARFDGTAAGTDALRKRLDVAPDDVLILAVGRMVHKKGFDILLEALARLDIDGWTAVVAGAGDELEPLRQRAGELGLGARVRFPGAVAHDDLPTWYSAADLFVMPSVRDHKGNVDGLPNVVLEAMASGRAIVGSRIGGIPAVIEPGVNGQLVDERDVPGLATALTRYIEKPDERRAAGAASRARVLAELTWKTIAGRYRDCYVEAGARG